MVVRMGRVLYFDCFSGASGDMMLGALVDLGVPLAGLREALAGVVPAGCRLTATRVSRSGIGAVRFVVSEGDAAPGPDGHGHDHGEPGHRHDGAHEHGRGTHIHYHPGGQAHAHSHDEPAAEPRPEAADGHAAHRGLPEILAMIAGSGLPAAVKDRASALFERLGRVEAGIHQVPVEQVHFHEVGALDSIVDIVGAVWAIDTLGASRIVASPLNTGGGTVRSAHGVLPVPAPATLGLLEGVPSYGTEGAGELVTPTGALLVAGHASSFGPMPPMTVRKIGYGAGRRDVPGRPNVLRAVLGDEPGGGHGRILSIECNVDDMNPQFFGGLFDRLLGAGALDVFFTPVHMKKNRPGTLVTVLAPPSAREAMSEVLFRETTTIGIRYHEVDRECLSREWTTVTTRFGPVRIKIARRGDAVVNAAPEFDDCAALAASANVAVREVHQAALQAYYQAAAP